jgi:hypothetical protein
MAYQTPAEAWAEERNAVQAAKDKAAARRATLKARAEALEVMNLSQRLLARFLWLFM